MSIRSERMPRSLIPPQLKLFEASDIDAFFRYAEKTFHLSPKWFTSYQRERDKTLHGGNEVEFFFAFVTQHLEPMLKQLLARPDMVTHALCQYLIREKIALSTKNEKEIRDFYKRR
ncbi:MAG TPA: hypothetical protein VK658_19150 [Chryseolinea sp.]|nr:hypothetical protein [Chryseolinea sp.]